VKVMAAVTQCAGGSNAPVVSTRCSWLNALQLVVVINYWAAVNPCSGGPSLWRRRGQSM